MRHCVPNQLCDYLTWFSDSTPGWPSRCATCTGTGRAQFVFQHRASTPTNWPSWLASSCMPSRPSSCQTSSSSFELQKLLHQVNRSGHGNTRKGRHNLKSAMTNDSFQLMRDRSLTCVTLEYTVEVRLWCLLIYYGFITADVPEKAASPFSAW